MTFGVKITPAAFTKEAPPDELSSCYLEWTAEKPLRIDSAEGPSTAKLLQLVATTPDGSEHTLKAHEFSDGKRRFKTYFLRSEPGTPDVFVPGTKFKLHMIQRAIVARAPLWAPFEISIHGSTYS